jgi:hypothetical protein
MRVQRSRAEVADIIEQFLDGTGGKWDWDDFCSFGIADPYLDSLRIQCCELQSTLPAETPGHYCNQAGFQVMRNLVAELRQAI